MCWFFFSCYASFGIHSFHSRESFLTFTVINITQLSYPIYRKRIFYLAICTDKILSLEMARARTNNNWNMMDVGIPLRIWQKWTVRFFLSIYFIITVAFHPLPHLHSGHCLLFSIAFHFSPFRSGARFMLACYKICNKSDRKSFSLFDNTIRISSKTVKSKSIDLLHE